MVEDMMPKPELMRKIRGSSVALRLEEVRCGKAGCRSCPHGPYWYAYWSKGGRTKSAYVGKETGRAVELAAALRRYGSRVSVDRVGKLVM